MVDSDVRWAAVLDHLRKGGVIAHPTETMYGLAAAMTADGIRALREMKERSPSQPFLLLLPAGEAGKAWSDRLRWTPSALALAGEFWPGPLTLILADDEGWAPEGVANREGGVAVRVSPHPLVRELLERWGAPLLSTSANPRGGDPARSALEVRERFNRATSTGELLVVDGEPVAPSPPSTLVDCTGPAPRILRHGAVSSEDIDTILHADTDDDHGR